MKEPQTNEEWQQLFRNFITFQFGMGQASGMFEAAATRCITGEEMDSWEEARNKYYGMTRGEMMVLISKRLER
jgi:hypothetical protein